MGDVININEHQEIIGETERNIFEVEEQESQWREEIARETWNSPGHVFELKLVPNTPGGEFDIELFPNDPDRPGHMSELQLFRNIFTRTFSFNICRRCIGKDSDSAVALVNRFAGLFNFPFSGVYVRLDTHMQRADYEEYKEMCENWPPEDCHETESQPPWQGLDDFKEKYTCMICGREYPAV